MTVYFLGDGGTFPAKGVLGGNSGATCGTWKRTRRGTLERQPDFDHAVANEKEAVHFRSCAGGSYGDPRKRDPARVLADVNAGWLSVAAARSVYGAAVNQAPDGVDYVLGRAPAGKRKITRRTS